MLLLTLFITLAIGVSFLCSLLEAVLLSVTPAYAQVYASEHPRAGQRLVRLIDNIDEPLAAILSLNTVAHTVGATGAGAQAAVVFGSAWLGLFSALLTLGILVFSEIIPKTIGAVYWRGLTGTVALVLPWMVLALAPLVWLSTWITALIKRDTPASISRAEISAMADIGHSEGVIERHESDLLRSLLEFRNARVEDVMTPTAVVGQLQLDETVAAASQRGQPFSRQPVVSADGIVRGYVLRDELLESASTDPHRSVQTLLRPLLRLRANLALPQALERLLEKREQIALVVTPGTDNALGVVTLEDVLETLLDVEIVDEVDPAVDMRTLAKPNGERPSNQD